MYDGAPGYAPIEQYSTKEPPGPWNDIYALGAVAYQLLTGKVPDEAVDRISADPLIPATQAAATGASAAFLEAIDAALRVFKEQRPQTLDAWENLLTTDSAGPVRGADRHGNVAIDSRLASDGGEIEITVDEWRGRVKIPPGARDQSSLRLAEAGRSGQAGGAYGDLYLQITVYETTRETSKLEIKHGAKRPQEVNKFQERLQGSDVGEVSGLREKEECFEVRKKMLTIKGYISQYVRGPILVVLGLVCCYYLSLYSELFYITHDITWLGGEKDIDEYHPYIYKLPAVAFGCMIGILTVLIMAWLRRKVLTEVEISLYWIVCNLWFFRLSWSLFSLHNIQLFGWSGSRTGEALGCIVIISTGLIWAWKFIKARRLG